MLRVAIAFFVFAILAYILGATGVGGMSLEVGRFFLVLFLVFSVVGVAIGLIGGDRPKDVI